MAWRAAAAGLLVICLAPIPSAASAEARLAVFPPSVVLSTPEASQQILVSWGTRPTDCRDVSRAAQYTVDPSPLASVDRQGLIKPRAEGKGSIVVRYGGKTLQLPLEVRGLHEAEPVSFDTQVLPVLSKARCNSGACHGKAEGQHGFKLSVFGHDPSADYDALVKDSEQRRLTRGFPERSLLLQKARNDIPHGGGRRIEPGSFSDRLLTRWIREGAIRVADSPAIMSIAVLPQESTLFRRQSQQLQVTATDARGQTFCVSRTAEYESNADFVAHVDSTGLVTATSSPGEAAVLVRYMGHVCVARITQPREDRHFSRPPENNVIDGLAWDRLERLGVQPSPLCDDATFLRRASLDVIGRLPTPHEVRTFLADRSRSRRSALVMKLLARPEYADYSAMRWCDLLRVDREKLTPAGALAVTRWLRRQFAENRPYDELVREILTARGDMSAEGPAPIYRALETPEELSRAVSQVFLGVRIECAHCHHHPFDRWSQDDYYGLAGFFTGVGRKPLPGGGTAIILTSASDLTNPRRNETVRARALGSPPADPPSGDDRRRALADWITSPRNPYFAAALVNRLWAQLMGRGLVEPVDDFRATNPPTNEPLLNDLSRLLVKSRYDIKAVLTAILNSRVYQLSAATNRTNRQDEQNFSHARPKALPAEVLLDAISDASGVPERFPGWPAGTRAVQLWDNDVESYFLKVFGRPVRATVCQCERGTDPSIAQALYLLNSQELAGKLESSGGRAARLADSSRRPSEIVEELYLATLSRFPSKDERAVAEREFVGRDRRAAAEDLLWALMNSKRFLYCW